MKNRIEIGQRLVGNGVPPYIVAEIGINWNGNMVLMRDTIKAAKDAGADAVKFQNYKTDKFIHQRSEYWSYYNDGKLIKERQRDMFKRNELDYTKLMTCRDICENVGIDWHTTPMCEEGLGEALAAGVKVLKNGSDCLQDGALIMAMARSGLPTVISTGMAYVSEIGAAVENYRAAYHETYGAGDGEPLILLHCTSAYPAPDNSINVKAIGTIRHTFGCLAGLSDHSVGVVAAISAVTLGACWIEKHFTLSRALPGPDHAFSSDPDEMEDLVFACHQAYKQRGTGNLGMQPIEKNNREKWFNDGR